MNIKEFFLTKINHTWFNSVIVLVTTGIIWFLINVGQIDMSMVQGEFAKMCFNIAIFLSTYFSLKAFQGGLGFNIDHQIYNLQNQAAAIDQAALKIALAIIIAKGLM